MSSVEGRTYWRYEDGGLALASAVRLVEVIRSADLPRRRDDLRRLVTARSWPQWEARVRAGFDRRLLQQLTHVSTKVRYPAPGMAYVFCLSTHPDQDEPLLIHVEQQGWRQVITLLEEGGEWRAHRLGDELVPPSAVGLAPYSW